MSKKHPTGQLIPLADYVESNRNGAKVTQYLPVLAHGFGICWHTLYHHLKKGSGHVFAGKEQTVFLINGRPYKATQDL